MEILQFKPEHLPLVISLARKAVDRPASDSFYRWLYLDAPSLSGLLAVEDSACVAMIWAFQRSYRMREKKCDFLEGFDWYCLPETRGSGIGVQLLRTLMKDFPMLTVDGTAEALNLLSRMQWKHLTDVSMFQLPLSGRLLAGNVAHPSPWTKFLEAGFVGTARQWFAPRDNFRPKDGYAVAVGSIGQEVLDLYWQDRDFDCLIPLPDERFIQWLLTAHPGVGHYLPLYFMIGSRLRGWSLSRIFESEKGTEAHFIDLFAPKSDAHLYPWIVAETCLTLAGFRPIRIVAKSNHPFVISALRKNRFISTATIPVYAWNCSGILATHELFFGSACNDSPFLPYAREWLAGG